MLTFKQKAIFRIDLMCARYKAVEIEYELMPYIFSEPLCVYILHC